MIRIRFHGRGGHGVKTASRIVGTAAFLGGYQVQDSPIYGAERRGAAITAFTRISAEPILERGIIVQADLIVIADETLLDDPTAGVLAGQEFAHAVFINMADATPLIERRIVPRNTVALDLTALARDKIGSAAALSGGLAAAASRLIGIVAREHLLEATREELGDAGLGAEQIDQNLSMVTAVFDALAPVPGMGESRSEPPSLEEMTSVLYHPPILGTPSILAAGNSAERHTGTWRVERPEIDYDRCTRCGICFVRCPDGAIALDSDGYPVIDYDHCKGCMICWDQCPVAGAIRKEKETHAW